MSDGQSDIDFGTDPDGWLDELPLSPAAAKFLETVNGETACQSTADPRPTACQVAPFLPFRPA